jgi:hypothetical protein
MAILTLGIDLAKNVFAHHGVDAAGQTALVRPSVTRGKLLELVSALPPCLIGMEACSGAHPLGPAVPGSRPHGAVRPRTSGDAQYSADGPGKNAG